MEIRATRHFLKTSMTLFEGDSLEILKTLPSDSVDSVVTDAPYGLVFMNKHWDAQVPSVDLWREVFRVMKPGAHLLSFGGTRTYHRMAVAIEDAGFEIRDQIQWIYGSGFPKSLDVSKAIDKAAGAEREVIGRNETARIAVSSDSRNLNQGKRSIEYGAQTGCDITAPATDAARQWQGFGTALKPANEPIVLARKPLSEKTVAKNVLKFGTGALNIDASRIATDDQLSIESGNSLTSENNPGSQHTQGRWPANAIFSEDAAAELDRQSGILKSGLPGIKNGGNNGAAYGSESRPPGTQMTGFGDSGGASRFFYVAKPSKRERNAGLEGMPEKQAGVKNSSGRGFSESDPHKEILRQNHHPTVKPVKLMEYLITLINPPGGVVLDPFLGSGTTLVAAAKLGVEGIGIEREAEYLEIAKRRIAHFENDLIVAEDNQLNFNLGN